MAMPGGHTLGSDHQACRLHTGGQETQRAGSQQRRRKPPILPAQHTAQQQAAAEQHKLPQMPGSYFVSPAGGVQLTPSAASEGSLGSLPGHSQAVHLGVSSSSSFSRTLHTAHCTRAKTPTACAEGSQKGGLRLRGARAGSRSQETRTPYAHASLLESRTTRVHSTVVCVRMSDANLVPHADVQTELRPNELPPDGLRRGWLRLLVAGRLRFRPWRLRRRDADADRRPFTEPPEFQRHWHAPEVPVPAAARWLLHRVTWRQPRPRGAKGERAACWRERDIHDRAPRERVARGWSPCRALRGQRRRAPAIRGRAV